MMPFKKLINILKTPGRKHRMGSESESAPKRTKWSVCASDMAMRTHNPIRAIVDSMKLDPNPDKDVIALSIGDPTVFGNLGPCKEMKEAITEATQGSKSHGYGPSVGMEGPRRALAETFTCPEAPLTHKDVILACGCSGAIEMALLVLANPGQNVLTPRPGFSLYNALCGSYAIEHRSYSLLPEREWEVDLVELESLIDDKTACILINNPSNPCGSVYTKQHLQDICAIAEKYRLPIISDEVYADMVFPGESYYSTATITTQVPVLTCGGLAKRFLVPGWRVGWIFIHDKHGAFEEVRKGLFKLSTRILGPCTVMQAAIPDILKKTPASFYENAVRTFQENAELSFKALSAVPGLSPIMPKGAMYMMFGIDVHKFKGFKNDVEFVQTLMAEESVFCLPGSCFQCPNYARVVLSLPKEKMQIACNRIKDFFNRHYCATNGV